MATDTMLPPLPGTKEIIGYGHWLMMRGRHAGCLCLDGHEPTAEEREITGKLRQLSEIIDNILTSCRKEDLGGLLDCYDISYRLGYRHEPSPAVIEKHRRSTFRAWRSGDRSIPESTVYHLLSPQMIRNCRLGDRLKYEKEWSKLHHAWLRTLSLNSRFPDASPCENYQRLALIMRADIRSYIETDIEADMETDTETRSYESQRCDSTRALAEKRRWYEQNRVDDLTALDTQTLRSYRRFVRSLFPSILDYSALMSHDNTILAELSARTDLDPYDRKAILLALQYDQYPEGA